MRDSQATAGGIRDRKHRRMTQAAFGAQRVEALTHMARTSPAICTSIVRRTSFSSMRGARRAPVPGQGASAFPSRGDLAMRCRTDSSAGFTS
jgi:hypothetical protein